MLGATGIFILLAFFYYEYVPEDAFASEEFNENKLETDDPKALEAGDIKSENPAFINDEIEENEL